MAVIDKATVVTPKDRIALLNINRIRNLKSDYKPVLSKRIYAAKSYG